MVGQLYRVIPNLQSLVSDLRSKTSFAEQNRLGKRGLEKFQIYDSKLEGVIKGKLEGMGFKDDHEIRIFRLPSNADMRIPGAQKLYTTNVFPKWSICKRHGSEDILSELEFRGGEWVLPCPRCQNENMRLGVGAGMRFIRACHQGHMDDIDWKWEVHQGDTCGGNAFSWKEEDNDFEARCITCGRFTTFRQIKSRERAKSIVCSRYMPEFQSNDGENCVEIEDGNEVQTARIVLKNASNLRISHIVSSLLIPPYSDRLYHMLKELSQALLFLQNGEKSSKEEVLKHFEQVRNQLSLTEEFFSVISDYDESSIQRSIKNVLEEMNPKAISETDAENSEFDQLLHVSQEGYPRPYNGEPANFLVRKEKVKEFHSKVFDLDFVVTPIDILNVTQAQVGYSREVKTRPEEQLDKFLITTTGRLVPTFYEETSSGKSMRWFIGSQLRGEGLFVYVKDHDVFGRRDEEAFETWKNLSDLQTEPGKKIISNPNYVWWHSLAHRLVNDLSIDSGFQSTAIQEKTYSRLNPDSRNYEGGVLFYAVQPGGDGTLGGLTNLAENFENILDKAADRLGKCSNDPICIERKMNPDRINGSACHACLIISETSCHVMNKFLDRRLLLGAINK